MGSNYLNADSQRITTGQRSITKLLVMLFAFAALMGMATVGGTSMAQTEQTAEAADPIRWLACRFDENSFPRGVYQFVSTDENEFYLYSKSYTGAGYEDVRGGLNSVLDYVRTSGGKNNQVSFEAINERIIGQTFEGSLPVDRASKPWKRWNKGAQVNPYDRFGVAGLTFSNYMGEWKFFYIDACEDNETPQAKYDTGASTNALTVAAWNVCSGWSVCNPPNNEMPDGVTREDIWGPQDDWEGRAKLAWRTEKERPGEMTSIRPDVLLLQEAGAAGTTDYICGEGMNAVDVEGARQICYNPEKFSVVSNEEYDGAVKAANFPARCNGIGGYAWAILEDKSFRRSVFVSMHTNPKAGNEAIRNCQAKFLTDLLKQKFSGSFYPMVVGGDMNSQPPRNWNAGSPENCSTLRGPRLEVSKELCAMGLTPVIHIASSPRDLNKNTFQGMSPWSSTGRSSSTDYGSHIDHIWVNGYVGVGEARVFAPSGRATSDHAMVSATINLNGTYVAAPGDPKDPQANKYYDTRIEPRSTWEDISTSSDVRTLQFGKGWKHRWGAALSTNVMNMIFFITKLIVVFTVALLGLAFADVSSLLGITDIIAGGNGEMGLFNTLHESLFTPLVVLAIAATGVVLFWKAIVKRQIREALGDTLKSVFCFLAAVIISVSPAWFISLPNNAAIVVQSIIASELNEGLAGGNGLCKSNVASILEGTSGQGSTDTKEAASLLEKASLNMQSSAGCTLWLNLLVRPWTEGQFGTEYKELYGTNNAACAAPSGGKCLGWDKSTGTVPGINRNFLWVGDPMVPLGGGTNGKFEFNWALFQISTQTNSHAPLLAPEDRGVSSKYSQGVAHDWWRVVDAMSNYNEVLKKGQACADCGSTEETAPYYHIEEADVMSEWDNWVGNNQGHRLQTVLSSVLIALLGVAGPLVFAALSVIYAVGIAILMAFAPIFFLLGCWAGRGWNIFMAWADLVINTTMKRIGLGVLTILSMAFTATILELMNDPAIGYWKGLLMLVILSLALIKSRHHVLRFLAFARFSTADLSGTASQLTGKVKGAGSAVGGLALAGAAGGMAGASSGTGFKGGALAGMKSNLQDLQYRNRTLRNVLDGAAMADKNGYLAKYVGQICAICGQPFQDGEAIGRVDDEGSTLAGTVHYECLTSRNPELFASYEELGTIAVNVDRARHESEFQGRVAREAVDNIAGRAYENIDEAVANLITLVETTNKEIALHETQEMIRSSRSGQKNDSPIPPIPSEIMPYVNRRNVEEAWRLGEYEYVKLAYASGWAAFAQSNDINLTEAHRHDILAVTQR